MLLKHYSSKCSYSHRRGGMGRWTERRRGAAQNRVLHALFPPRLTIQSRWVPITTTDIVAHRTEGLIEHIALIVDAMSDRRLPKLIMGEENTQDRAAPLENRRDVNYEDLLR